MRSRSRLVLIGLVLAWVAATSPLAAQDGREQSPGSLLAAPSAADGWSPIADGVWERTDASGNVETRASGKAGLAWDLQKQRAELEALVSEYLAKPDPELKKLLDIQLQINRDLENSVKNWTAQVAPGLVSPACAINWQASAGPISCGNKGSADVSYFGSSEEDCFGSCYIYAYAFTTRGCGGKYTNVVDHCSDTGINIACSAQSVQTGCYTSCWSKGKAKIICPDFTIQKTLTNTVCSSGGLCCTCAKPFPDDTKS